MKNLWTGRRFEILFAAVLTLFTVYALLDTFVIPRRYASVPPDGDTVTLNGGTAQNPVQREEQDAQDGHTEGAGESTEGAGESTEGAGETAPEHREAPENWAFPDNGEAPENWSPPDNREVPEDWSPPEDWNGGGFPPMPGNFPRRRSGHTAEGSAGRGGTSRGGTSQDSTSQGGTPEGSGSTPEDGKAQGEIIRSWSNENISITITQYRVCNTDAYVADVALSSPEYLKTALAGNAYGRNIKEETSVIAAAHNAVLAVNGDFYGARNSGYVIRGGTLYRDSGQGGDVLAIMGDGSFQIVDDRQVTAQELLDSGAVQVLSFGPALVKDGETAVTEGQQTGRNMADNPRTAIGMTDTLHYVFVTVDGRSSQSQGMTLQELAEFLRGLGAETAYNLDGGGSSTMVFNGEVINHPTTTGRSGSERSVSDIVYIGT